MIGGTCVNVGCVPSKAMLRAAETLYQARAASRFAGIKAEARIEDWKALTAQKDELVTTLRRAKYGDILPSYSNVAYIEGAAQLTGGGVSVDGELISADKMIVATGTSAAAPQIDGIDDVPHLTSTEALELDALPKSILVIGGGYIGCELAQILGRSGVDVTIVCRFRLLAGQTFDKDVSKLSCCAG